MTYSIRLSWAFRFGHGSVPLNLKLGVTWVTKQILCRATDDILSDGERSSHWVPIDNVPELQCIYFFFFTFNLQFNINLEALHNFPQSRQLFCADFYYTIESLFFFIIFNLEKVHLHVIRMITFHWQKR